MNLPKLDVGDEVTAAVGAIEEAVMLVTVNSAKMQKLHGGNSDMLFAVVRNVVR